MANPIPPIEEQRRVVDEIERIESSLTVTAALTARETVRIGRLHQSILKWAFEGKLVDQDPNDEPAEKLLERIRAERAAAAAAANVQDCQIVPSSKSQKKALTGFADRLP